MPHARSQSPTVNTKPNGESHENVSCRYCYHLDHGLLCALRREAAKWLFIERPLGKRRHENGVWENGIFQNGLGLKGRTSTKVRPDTFAGSQAIGSANLIAIELPR